MVEWIYYSQFYWLIATLLTHLETNFTRLQGCHKILILDWYIVRDTGYNFYYFFKMKRRYKNGHAECISQNGDNTIEEL
jgi:hypothetical protein